MRKGFLHIVEALIVIMLVFMVLSNFYTIPRPEESWTTAKLTAMSQDLLYSMDENGVNWTDFNDVNSTLYSILPPTAGYAVNLHLDVRPVTKILCVGSDANCTYLKTLIMGNSITLNNIDRKFTITNVTPAVMDFSLDSSYMDNDVILFWGFPSITPEEASNLSQYLSEGNGVVEYAGLNKTEVETRWHGDIFNLTYVSDSTRPPSINAEFQELQPTDHAYNVMKIYNATGANMLFKNFGSERIYPSSNMESRILVKQNGSYTGGIYDGMSVPLTVVNWAVRGKGRTAWMSNGTMTDQKNRDLLRALVMWAGGGKDYVLITSAMTQSVRSSFRKILNTDMYEPMRVDLQLGYHF